MVTTNFRDLLINLIGAGFTVSITFPGGGTLNNRKIVTVTNDTVFTTTAAGLVNAIALGAINAVDY